MMSPVPGGVGPVTTAVLLRTTMSLAEAGIAQPNETKEA
jgi:5,10-methylene-tetrahydrofolate dehydrogenase/methenyl tetrahydrofolate cyclohydrolase